DDVAATAEVRVLVADGRERVGRRPGGVLRAVDEAEQVALVEVLEAVCLVDDVDPATEPGHDLAGELEAEVELAGPQMEQQIAGGRDRDVTVARDLTK